MPNYTGYRWTKDGKTAFHWTVKEIWESECPVSSITQRSFELVQLVNSLQGVQGATGSTVGADDMPGYLLDAIRICQSEVKAVEAAMDEELHK
jgi:hypothetical protein